MIQTSKGNINLSRALFWDINEKNIEKALTESPDWVIPRVFEYGELNEISAVIKLYGEEKAKEALTKTRLRPVARAMALIFLDLEIPIQEERPLYYK